MKRSYEEIIESSLNESIEMNKKLKNQDNVDSFGSFNCDICETLFTTSSSLKQHNETVHSKTSTWICSDCKKTFTSKSNLKVHLRVHTRIKPYHCKSCNYSCMHHSSIKEHLAKIHPNVIHSTSNPAYVFNSIAVPDPEQFNSNDFNKEQFIAEAKIANDKLVAQIYHNQPISLLSASSVTISPISNLSSLNSTRNELTNQDDDEDEYIDVGLNPNSSSTSSSSDLINDDSYMNLSKQSNHENSFRIKTVKDKSKLKRSKPKFKNQMNDSLDSSTNNNGGNNTSKNNLSFSISSIMNNNSTSPTNVTNSSGSSIANSQIIQNYADFMKKFYPSNQYTNTIYQNYNVNNASFPIQPVANIWPFNNYNMFYNILNQFKSQQNLM